jgi:hypothetical protein
VETQLELVVLYGQPERERSDERLLGAVPQGLVHKKLKGKK